MKKLIKRPVTSPSLSGGAPQDLFAACKTKEVNLKQHSKTWVTQQAGEALFVCHPLFTELPIAPEGLKKLIEGRYPWDFSIIRQKNNKDNRASALEWKYQSLLSCVKNIPSAELRLLCLARWLKQEGVCEPEELLPSNILKRLLREFAQKEGIRWQRSYDAAMVRIWLPYFEALLSARHKISHAPRGSRDALLRQGFEGRAIEAANGKRSPVPATTAWLEQICNKDARTLENAYSCVESRRQKRRHELS